MIAFRRTEWNFALDRAVEWAKELRKPLLVFEPLRVGYRWASDRLHRFVIDGMAENARQLARQAVLYYPYVEPTAGAGKGLLAALAKRACVVVTDDFPCFFLPQMVAAAADKLTVLVERVDSNGIVPVRAADDVFATAYAFRRYLQKNLRPHLEQFPRRHPLAGIKLPQLKSPPISLTKRWPPASGKLLAGDPAALATLPIDHSVAVVRFHGGSRAAQHTLDDFIERRLSRYADSAPHPDEDTRSGLSPYLHFGHISAHEMFAAIAKRENWSIDRLSEDARGRREGWWGMSPAAEAFLDQLATWRELGFNMASKRDDYDRYESLPDWAQRTLAKHNRDRRPHIYSLDELAAAQTDDVIWNAAQRQLVREGRIHNYLRMFWGKRILEWAATPQEALSIMIELNNRYAADGRDPNSYSGIFWTLGRYDRPWGPERPIFGTVRYLSSASTRRKLRMDNYLSRFGETAD